MTRNKHWLILTLICVCGWSHADEDAQPRAYRKPDMVESSSVIGFVPKDGLFVAGDIGLFSVFGGYTNPENSTGARSKVTLSNIDAFIGLTVGYDFSRNLGIGIKLATGSVTAAARSQTDLESPTDFALYLADANVMGAISVTNRFRFVFNGFGGLTIMSPPISLDAKPYGVNAGVTVGILYDTLLADMVVGLNLGGYAFINFDGPADANRTFFAASITPVLKYVF